MNSRLHVFGASSRAALIGLLRDRPAGGGRPYAASGDPGAPHRLAIVSASAAGFDESRDTALRALESRDGAFALGGRIFYRDLGGAGRAPTACLFPGYGVRHTAIVDDLLATFPFIEDWLDALGSGTPRGSLDRTKRAAATRARRAGRLTRPLSRSLDAVMLADLAIWEVLTAAGVACDAVAGHSYGENAALVAAGLVDDYPALVRALEAISREARLDDPEGAGMVAVTAASMPAIAPALAGGRLVVALDNCPRQIVVWGEAGALAEAEAALRARGDVVFRLGELQRPIHTERFPVELSTLRDRYASLHLDRARVPVWSAATVDRLPGDPEAVRELLARQWRSPVRFRPLIERLYDEGIRTFVEAGPGDRLSGFVRDTLRGAAGVTTIPTNIEARPAIEQLQIALGRLFVAGHDLDWAAFDSPEDASATAPLEAIIAAHVGAVLDTDAASLDRTAGFFELGLGSMGCLELVERLARVDGIDVPQTMPFDHPSISRLAEAIADVRGGRARREVTKTRAASVAAEPVDAAAAPDIPARIAIVGIGCRFPGGADSPEAFWRLLDEQIDAVTETPVDRRELPDGALDALDADTRARTAHGAFLSDVAGFDASFFGIAPREAIAMDPQQRLLLEVAWEALEDAAIDPRALAGSAAGVFVGISNADYASRLTPAERIAAGGYVGLGNTASVAAGRLSYVLGLHGPSFAIDTACSSSLAAVHLACRSLRAGECDVALAGGVNLLLNGETTIFLASARALSPSGRCRPFDASADGYVRGEGCGLVVLKREADALRDGDRVVAVIHGSAMNHDGRTSGLTVPNGLSQEAVVRAALADAAVEPSRVTYVEAHGTGTPLGDPIEASALGRVFEDAGERRVAIGSVKSNIGHLEAAAGVASLIKTALQCQHRRMAASLNVAALNPRVDWPSMPVRVASCGEVWNEDRLAGVSAFGMSGTNVHVIVGPAPDVRPPRTDASASNRPRVVAVSAQTPQALVALAARIADAIERDASISIDALSLTLTLGRAQLRRRAAAIVRSRDEALAWLRALASGQNRDAGATQGGADDVPAELVRAFLGGATVDWRPLQRAGITPARLPSYPFERQRYWIDRVATEGVRGGGRASEDTDGDLSRSVRDAAESERPALVAGFVRDLVASVLQLPEGQTIDERRPLGDAGLDSIMALQIATTIAGRLGVAMGAEAVIEGATIESLAAHVLERLGADDVSGEQAPVLPAPSTSDTAPLSYGQQALWFLWMLAPDSAAYNQSIVIELPDGDEARARRRAERLLRRHPALRTRIVMRDGEPEQRIDSADRVEWTSSDVSGFDASAIDREMAAERARPFDLGVSPVRFRWFARGGGARLLVTIHHTACDAWSLEIVRRELEPGSDAAQHPAPRYGYQDFARWQRARLAGPEGDRLWAFWRETLAEPRAQLDLPLDRERPATRTDAGDSVRRAIDARRADALREMARASGVTPFVALITVFYAVLYRWTRQTDLVVGTMSAARSHPAFADVVGYFVEPVPVRVSADGAAALPAWMADVQQASRAALAHADFPFPLLVERLGAPRDAARSPIFDVTFNFLSRRAGGAPPISDVEMPGADTKFDLTLTAIDHAGGIDLVFGYNASLFTRDTIESVAGWFDRLLDVAAAGGDVAVDAIPLVPRDSAAPIAWKGRALSTDALLPVHEQIRAVAAARPTANAVAGDSGTLTYQELVTAADALAAGLRDAGLVAGDRVVLVSPRSGDWVVGMLGILFAGGAFVPIDPATTATLAARMQRTAGARFEIDGRRCRRLIDGPRSASEQLPADVLDRLAYVIFTSGSTGDPKGVMVDHRALANYAASIVDDLAIVEGATHAWVSTPAADLGHTAIFPALTTGGMLVVASESTVTERSAFARFMSSHAIDYLKIVPAHLAALTETAGSSDDARLSLPAKGLFLGGEAAPAAWLARIRRHATCRIFNHYGPTETTVGVMTAEIDGKERGPAPLARPVANVTVQIVDAALEPVPRGVPGEVIVSGPCVARGYLGAASEAAARFVELPGAGRAYRTGDLARMRADGALVLMGRADGQFKLRGYRIETGQIENAIAAHPAIAQTVVLPRVARGAAEGIDAWIVLASQRDTSIVDELRAWLEARLPAYMVPDRIMPVARIPLTPNGKIDRAALASIAATEARPVAMPAPAPTDPIVARVLAIWRDVLGRDGIGASDDFFAAGGHSLAAVRVASRIADEWAVQLPLATFFAHRTPARIAALLRDHLPVSRKTSPALVDLHEAAAGSDTLVLFPGAGGSLLYFEPLVAALGDAFAITGVGAAGLAAGERAPATVEEIAERYTSALAVRRPAPLTLAGHSFGALVAFETALRLRARGARVDAVVAIDNPAPGLDPGPGPERDWAEHIAVRIERLYGVDLEARTPRGDAPAHEWLARRMRAAGVLPAEADDELVRRYIDLYRANVVAAAAYRPAAPLADVPITVVRAAAVDRGLAQAGWDEPALGWQAWSALPVTLVSVPGTHITMLTEPHVRQLARVLHDLAGRAPARAS